MTPLLCACAVVITFETQKCQKKAPRSVEFNFFIDCDRHKRISQNERRRADLQNVASDFLIFALGHSYDLSKLGRVKKISCLSYEIFDEIRAGGRIFILFFIYSVCGLCEQSRGPLRACVTVGVAVHCTWRRRWRAVLGLQPTLGLH